MAWVNFSTLRSLSPAAFKLYVYFLDQLQTCNASTLTRPLADLGFESGLQAPNPYRTLRHGKDGQLRKALKELIDRGLIEKQGQRGRSPNTYRLLDLKADDNPTTLTAERRS